jgi:telomerase reverse transcriptase
MQYMFPRQFGLHNVFTSKVDPRETAMPFKDYTLREKDIHSSMCRELGGKATNAQAIDKWKLRIPKRLRGDVFALVRKLRTLNQRCSYMELLRHYCPVEVPAQITSWRWASLIRTGRTTVSEARVEEERTSAKGQSTPSRRASEVR